MQQYEVLPELGDGMEVAVLERAAELFEGNATAGKTENGLDFKLLRAESSFANIHFDH